MDNFIILNANELNNVNGGSARTLNDVQCMFFLTNPIYRQMTEVRGISLLKEGLLK